MFIPLPWGRHQPLGMAAWICAILGSEHATTAQIGAARPRDRELDVAQWSHLTPPPSQDALPSGMPSPTPFCPPPSSIHSGAAVSTELPVSAQRTLCWHRGILWHVHNSVGPMKVAYISPTGGGWIAILISLLDCTAINTLVQVWFNFTLKKCGIKCSSYLH